ncbi:hypothetical protein D9M71_808590 [compost metagenome]
MLAWNWALVLMIGSLRGSMQLASTESSLQINYYIENLIIYTYVLGQIYSTFVRFMLAKSDEPRTSSEKTKAAAGSPAAALSCVWW